MQKSLRVERDLSLHLSMYLTLLLRSELLGGEGPLMGPMVPRCIRGVVQKLIHKVRPSIACPC